MRTKLETAATTTAAQALDPKKIAAVEAVERENKLMTSAWFDLAARLQTNTVILGRGRRKEPPKSWLGKQREILGLGIGIGGRMR